MLNSAGFETPKSSLEPKGGPICLVMEQADGPIRDPLLASPAMVPVAAGADVRASVDSSEGEASV